MIAAVVALMLAVAACGHGGMTEQAARAAVDTVEAHYKAYATVEADLPLIDEADRRLDRRGVDRRTRVRAALYHGAVLDELGRADSALLHYKRAEAACDTADHDLLGYINLRIAELFRCSTVADSAAVGKYKRAFDEYIAISNPQRQAQCLNGIGLSFMFTHPDSASHYILRAVAIASMAQDPVGLNNCLSSLVFYYYHNHQYLQAKNIAVQLMQRGDSSCCVEAICSFVNLNMLDSASYYLNRFPSISAIQDSVAYYKAESQILLARGDYIRYVIINNRCRDLSDSLVNDLYETNLFKVEQKYDNELLKNRNLQLENDKIWLYVFLSLACLLILALCMIAHWISSRNHIIAIQNEQLKSELEHSAKMLAEMHSKLTTSNLQPSMSGAIDSIQSVINTINEYLFQTENIPNKPHLVKNLLKLFRQNVVNEAFWNGLEQYVEHQNKDLLSKLKETYPDLTEDDIHFICLHCCHFSPITIMLCMNFTNASSVRNHRRLIVRKHMHIADMTLDQVLDSIQNITKTTDDNP